MTCFLRKDMKALQVDYFSIPAPELVPHLLELPLSGNAAEARDQLRSWNYSLGPNSVAAAIYVAFETELRSLANSTFIPETGKNTLGSIQMKKVLDWIVEPYKRFGPNPDRGMADAFNQGVAFLDKTLGGDMENWQYGQEKFKVTDNDCETVY